MNLNFSTLFIIVLILQRLVYEVLILLPYRAHIMPIELYQWPDPFRFKLWIIRTCVLFKWFC